MKNRDLVRIIRNNIREVESIIESFADRKIIPEGDIELSLDKIDHIRKEITMLNSDPDERESAGIQAPDRDSEILSSAVESEKTEKVRAEDVKIDPAKAVEPEEFFKESIPVPEVEQKKTAIPEDLNLPPAPEQEKAEVAGFTPEEVKKVESSDKPGKISLGDNYSKSVKKSLNDQAAESSANRDVASNISGKPVSDIKEAIGINDRVMYTRELFENDSNRFNATLIILNNKESYHQALNYLKATFPWDEGSETVTSFLKVVRRRFPA